MFSSKYFRWNRGCFLSYTIYPDELFVTNLVMDYYLLRLVKKLCGGRAGVLASLGGAAFGALSYCMLILFPVSFPVNTLLAYVAINTIMVRFGCGLRTPGRLCGGIAGLYIAGFLMGGMLEVLKRFLGFAGTKDVLLAGTVCYLVYAAVLPRYREWRKKSRIRCRVRLQMEGQITEVNAFFDTGNSLYDPIAQKPVSIIQKGTLEKLCDADTMEKLQEFQRGKAEKEPALSFRRMHPHFLAYSSLGCSCGLLVAVTLDAMYLENENVQKVIHAPVVAFSGEDSSAFGDCQMILHPNLIDS